MKVVQIPIAMICSTDIKGNITPVRFKITVGDETNAYDITRINSSDNIRVAGEYIKTFDCEFIDNGVKKLCEIRYMVGKTVWLMWRV